MNKKNAYILIMLLIPSVLFAEKVKVRVFSTAKITYTKVSFENASYSLVGDNVDTIASNLKRGDFVELTPFAKEVVVSINGQKRGNFSNVTFVSYQDDAYLYISPKGEKQRSYEDNLIVSTMRHFAEVTGASLPKFALKQYDRIPLTRGLGSSAACIVAGLLAANELTGNKVSREYLMNIAVEIEESFGLSLSDSNLHRIKTVGDIAELLEKATA